MTEDRTVKIKWFGARKAAKSALADLGSTAGERDALASEVRSLQEDLREAQAVSLKLKEEMRDLGALDVLELERRRSDLAAAIERQRVEADSAEIKRRERERSEIATADTKRRQMENELAGLRQVVIGLTEEAELQEVGVYNARHPLADSVAYRERISRLQQRIKTAARADGNAVSGTTNWTVNNSEAKGRAMVRELSKLMLRAYNGEADVLVRSMRPYKLESSKERLNKAHAAIERLGRTMQIQIAGSYHALRLEELELTADFINQLAVEREAEREEKARLREERKAQQEMERERQRLEKERTHYANALAKLETSGNVEGVERLRAQLQDIERSIDDVDYRAANIRAGYVYVISNVGSFGERMVKVGMTRRLDPIDRVKELSDASVPFNFDVHALFFSNDAVGIETKMHQLLAKRRVNQVNHRREFFYATPSEVRDLLANSTGELLEFTELPEAPEFRQSPRPQQVGPGGSVH